MRAVQRVRMRGQRTLAVVVGYKHHHLAYLQVSVRLHNFDVHVYM